LIFHLENLKLLIFFQLVDTVKLKIMAKKGIVCCISLILFINASPAQKLKVSYGGVFGINVSSMDSRSYISESYLSIPPTSIRNLTLTTTSRMKFGYNAGIYINVQPTKSHLMLETGLLVSTYNNSYIISVEWEQYYPTTGNYWGPVSETERLYNEFSIISIPLIAGYDFIHKDNLKFCILLGLSNNINMKEEQIRYNPQLNEVKLYKPFHFSYQSGISMVFNRISCRIRYERSLNIKRSGSEGYIPYPSMKVERIFINSISLSFGIKLNTKTRYE
jgi:hypothetical protein